MRTGNLKNRILGLGNIPLYKTSATAGRRLGDVSVVEHCFFRETMTKTKKEADNGILKKITFSVQKSAAEYRD